MGSIVYKSVSQGKDERRVGDHRLVREASGTVLMVRIHGQKIAISMIQVETKHTVGLVLTL